MHDNHVLIENRVARVLLERISTTVHEPVAPLTVEAWHVAGGRGEPVQPSVALPGGDATAKADAGVDYQPFAVGDPWGPAWGTTWFHVTGTVPPEAEGNELEIVIDLGWQNHSPGFQSEGLVYRPDGSVVKALNPRNVWIPVEGAAGDPIDLYIEAAANPLLLDVHPFLPTDEGDKLTSSHEPIYTLARADVDVFHRELWELAADLTALLELELELPLGEPRRWNILRAMERAMDVLELSDVPGSAASARQELVEVLSAPANASAHTVTAIGHAHIDSAWLWPMRETVRKVARTSSNVLNLLESDGDFQFAMSSAQQYAWIKEYRPEVFERVKKAVADGRFVPVGGMWVESDTNMVGSEAMARQFVHGQKFFMENFGIHAHEVWLPDSFGYSAALPQIVTLAGMKWFLTQKISWNQTNLFPHHSFNWEGIDGTRVFTHFPPADTYNSNLSGKELAHAVRNYRDKGASNHSLVPFGWGDGGGGPTREMLQAAKRTRDLEGSPKVVIRTPAEFFAEAQREYVDAPVWKGELYLELHRGTLTSQGKTKQGNRRSEHLLHEAELWAATAAIRGVADYPHAELDRIWKLVLVHQFHDVLPGTSIAWVHREAAERYQQIAEDLHAIIESSQRALAGEGDAELVFNASPFARDGVPSYGAALSVVATTPVDAVAENGGFVLDNGRIRIVVEADGTLGSVRDLAADREVLPAGESGNLLQVHNDFPNMWDAWDIDEFYKNTVVDLRDVESLELLRSADGSATVRIARAFGSSHIVQNVTVAPDSTTVDIDTIVDWHEQEKLLKVAFPIDVHTDQAAFETQFGHLVRSTHVNTTWDTARFEVSAHRWVHVGERGYGAAVVNDSTYGHDVARHESEDGGSYTTVRLSLLRGPKYPDPQTDQGEHRVRFGLVVGAELGEAVEAGYAINLPERRIFGATPVAPIARTEGAVVLETVKLAEDESGDVIVRLYEPLGSRARATVTPDFAFDSAWETDLLEQPLDGAALVSSDGGELALRLRPFQIVTVRLRRR
ncbi:alpha-mannosidase [Lacisediminihabitans changchengi]|uniref:Alpha-mannosidase n=1 Tax=Lacisediminihabitans changchengi TaxID=2787634 RepID=A0A934SQF7_9MICO|nr:glycoside hydrolase family 38 C-terminal domain-containing protein [Lacisediminihabitans changchengi]MBK4346289.1 alpha-mannosidase [Lacisediminihabitans changchengi]